MTEQHDIKEILLDTEEFMVSVSLSDQFVDPTNVNFLKDHLAETWQCNMRTRILGKTIDEDSYVSSTETVYCTLWDHIKSKLPHFIRKYLTINTREINTTVNKTTRIIFPGIKDFDGISQTLRYLDHD